MKDLNTTEPTLSHGHLTTNNILISQDMQEIKIIDFGFFYLKKYCGLLSGYQNKSQYTSPEQLEEKGSVVLTANEKGDIYSFGFIMWEIMTDQIPFEGVSLQDIKRYVVIGKNRPKLDDEFPKDVAHLIRVCWQTDYTNRPTFLQVDEYINKIDSTPGFL